LRRACSFCSSFCTWRRFTSKSSRRYDIASIPRGWSARSKAAGSSRSCLMSIMAGTVG
jgi:hypothetical protein